MGFRVRWRDWPCNMAVLANVAMMMSRKGEGKRDLRQGKERDSFRRRKEDDFEAVERRRILR